MHFANEIAYRCSYQPFRVEVIHMDDHGILRHPAQYDGRKLSSASEEESSSTEDAPDGTVSGCGKSMWVPDSEQAYTIAP